MCCRVQGRRSFRGEADGAELGLETENGPVGSSLAVQSMYTRRSAGLSSLHPCSHVELKVTPDLPFPLFYVGRCNGLRGHLHLTTSKADSTTRGYGPLSRSRGLAQRSRYKLSISSGRQ